MITAFANERGVQDVGCLAYLASFLFFVSIEFTFRNQMRSILS